MIHLSSHTRRFSVATRYARSRGFSLYDLLTTLTVVGVVTASGAGFMNIVHSTAQTAEINTLIAHLNLTRSEAVKRGQDVVLCPSTDGRSCDRPQDPTWWHRGMLLFVDRDGDRQPDTGAPVIRAHQLSTAALQIKTPSGRPRVVYQPNGVASGTNLTFTLCDPRGTSSARYVIVSNTGRARVSSIPPDGRADEASERCP